MINPRVLLQFLERNSIILGKGITVSSGNSAKMGNQPQGGKKEEVEDKQGTENEKTNTDPAKHYKVVIPHIPTDLLAERKAEEEQRQKDIEDELKILDGKEPSEENEGEDDEEALEKMRRERTLNRLRRDKRNQHYYCDGCHAPILENRYHCTGMLPAIFKESFLPSFPPAPLHNNHQPLLCFY